MATTGPKGRNLPKDTHSYAKYVLESDMTEEEKKDAIKQSQGKPVIRYTNED